MQRSLSFPSSGPGIADQERQAASARGDRAGISETSALRASGARPQWATLTHEAAKRYPSRPQMNARTGAHQKTKPHRADPAGFCRSQDAEAGEKPFSPATGPCSGAALLLAEEIEHGRGQTNQQKTAHARRLGTFYGAIRHFEASLKLMGHPNGPGDPDNPSAFAPPRHAVWSRSGRSGAPGWDRGGAGPPLSRLRRPVS